MTLSIMGEGEITKNHSKLSMCNFWMLGSMYPELQVNDHPNVVSWDPIGTNSQQTWEGEF